MRARLLAVPPWPWQDVTDAASVVQLPLGHVGIITDAFSLSRVRCQQVQSLRQRLHPLANAGEKGQFDAIAEFMQIWAFPSRAPLTLPWLTQPCVLDS